MSDQLPYWSDDKLLFLVVNVFLVLELPNQLRKRQEESGIKYGKLMIERMSGARVSQVSPLPGHCERPSRGTLQDQSFNTGDGTRFKNGETFAFQRVKGVRDRGTARRHVVDMCNSL